MLLTFGDIFVASVLAVVIAVAKPSFVNALMNHFTLKLIAAALTARDGAVITVRLVRHVQTVVVSIALPRQLHAPTVGTRELRRTIARHQICEHIITIENNAHREKTRQVDESKRGIPSTSTLTVCHSDTWWKVVPKKAAEFAEMSTIIERKVG